MVNRPSTLNLLGVASKIWKEMLQDESSMLTLLFAVIELPDLLGVVEAPPCI